MDVFTGSSSNGLEFASEYDLDEEIKSDHLPPLICDADSSQHSALVDAARGRNLVIEGPPGTGKSQTITNLIGSFLAQGKRVLFVAEKMAALEVVKRRLDQFGLGHFCLELHSHKTSKVALLKSLEARIAAHKSFSESTLLPHKASLLASHRDDLTKYVKLLNRPYGALAQSPFDYIWRREELRRRLSHATFQCRSVTFPTACDWDFSAVQDRRDRVATFEAHLRRFSDAGGSVDKKENPWWWLPSCSLDLSGQQRLLDVLRTLKSLCEQQCSIIAAFLNTYANVVRNPQEWLLGLESWADWLVEAGPDANSSLFEALAQENGFRMAQEFMSQMNVFFSLKERLPSPDLLLSPDFTEELATRTGAATALGLEHFTLDQMKSIVETTEEARRQSIPVQRAVQELGGALEVKASFSLRCLSDLLSARLLLDSAPLPILHLRDPKFAVEGLSRALGDGKSRAEELLRQCDAMAADFFVDTDTRIDELDRAALVLKTTPWFKRWFSSEYRNAKLLYRAHCRHDGKKTRAQMVAGLWHLSEFKKKIRAFNESPDFSARLGSDFRGLNTPWGDLIALTDWYEQLSVGLPDHIPFALQLRSAILSLPTARIKAILNSSPSDVPRKGDLKVFSETLEQLHCLLPVLQFDRAETRIDDFLAEAEHVANRCQDLLRTVELLGLPSNTTVSQVVALITDARRLSDLRHTLNSNTEVKVLLGPLYAGVETDRTMLGASADLVERVLNGSLPPELKRWLLCEEYRNRKAWISDWLSRHSDNAHRFDSCERVITGILNCQIPHTDRLSIASLQSAIHAVDSCTNRADLLPMWIDVRHAADRLGAADLQYLVDAVLAHGLPIEELRPGFDFLFYDSLIRRLFDDHPELWRMTGTTQDELRRRFAELDRAVIELSRLDVAYRASRRPVPAGVRGAVVRDTTDLALVLHEISKQKQHIPIRQLMLRASGAIQALKPCFMMSPMSVAQFLAPGQVQFDLVVMDEASQLRPEEALGAIARGGQLVVVGDPKQLPPTSFFQRTLDDEEEDENKALASEGESILDIALGRYQPVRRLRWHYRSQHQSLIAFSNREFYDGDLVVFPSAYHDHADLGVKYVRVQGAFENRRNPLEAERVVEAILDHILQHPSESLGVVTMNFEQRELIEELLDARLSSDTFLSTWVEGQAETPEPFFIKNLENVQGDERDVIFISVTYGKDAKGNLFQRFSGVNSASGHRRLNVLVTRAKKRTVVFSSIDGDQIQVGSSTPWGVKALKGYLDYAKRGITSQPEILPGAEPANEHEAAIGYVLKDHGYQVVPQIGVSGYFIDLGVRHPKKPGAFLLGIEFDGKSYHSGRSARDRDRLRQMTLENQGWKIHRIWSTDWFKNREAEIDRLLKKVRTLEAS